jgi:hypothetical protein
LALVFFAEALIHYNIGVNKGKEKFELDFPKGRELGRIAFVVLTASVVSNYLSKKLL